MVTLLFLQDYSVMKENHVPIEENKIKTAITMEDITF
jgi:hypothetical protein